MGCYLALRLEEMMDADCGELTGRSTPVKGKDARTLRLLLTKRWMVLSPSNETFKIGERGGNQDLFCTCQGASAKGQSGRIHKNAVQTPV